MKFITLAGIALAAAFALSAPGVRAQRVGSVRPGGDGGSAGRSDARPGQVPTARPGGDRNADRIGEAGWATRPGRSGEIDDRPGRPGRGNGDGRGNWPGRGNGRGGWPGRPDHPGRPDWDNHHPYYWRYAPYYPFYYDYLYLAPTLGVAESTATYDVTAPARPRWVPGHYEEVPMQDVIEGEFVEVFHPAVYRRAEGTTERLELVEPESTSREPKVRIVLARMWIDGRYEIDDETADAGQTINREADGTPQSQPTWGVLPPVYLNSPTSAGQPR